MAFRPTRSKREGEKKRKEKKEQASGPTRASVVPCEKIAREHFTGRHAVKTRGRGEGKGEEEEKKNHGHFPQFSIKSVNIQKITTNTTHHFLHSSPGACGISTAP